MSDYLDCLGDENIEGTFFEEPFLVAVLWILRIPKFIESHKRMRENGHFNKEFRTHPTTWCNVQSYIFLDTIWAKFSFLYAHMVQRPSGQLLPWYCETFIFSTIHMVLRHVIRSRYPRRICPYWLNPHGASSDVCLYFGHPLYNILLIFMSTWYNNHLNFFLAFTAFISGRLFFLS